MLFFFQKVPEGNQDFPSTSQLYFIVIIKKTPQSHFKKDPFTEMNVAHALVWFYEIVRFRVLSSILMKMVAPKETKGTYSSLVAPFVPTHSTAPVTLYGSDPLHSNLAAS